VRSKCFCLDEQLSDDVTSSGINQCREDFGAQVGILIVAAQVLGALLRAQCECAC
jgi:hypothetical protein